MKNGVRGVHSGNKKRSIAYFMRVTQFRNLFLPFKNLSSPVSPNPPGNNRISLGHIFFNQRHPFCNNVRSKHRFLLIENVKILKYLNYYFFLQIKEKLVPRLRDKSPTIIVLSKLFGFELVDIDPTLRISNNELRTDILSRFPTNDILSHIIFRARNYYKEKTDTTRMEFHCVLGKILWSDTIKR